MGLVKALMALLGLRRDPPTDVMDALPEHDKQRLAKADDTVAEARDIIRRHRQRAMLEDAREADRVLHRRTGA